MRELLELRPEWDRLAYLASLVASQRRGDPVRDAVAERVQPLQVRVAESRQRPRWRAFVETHALLPLDEDLLVAALAPEVEPRIGWAYQELQPGASPYASLALLRELLFLEDHELPMLRARVLDGAPLRRHALVDPVADPYQPIRATPAARRALVGSEAFAAAVPPGSIEIPVTAGWDSLVVPRACRRALEEVVSHVRHRDRIERAWGARPSGGPIALFAGASGTGKSFAAEVVAHALGFRLMRVDLGLLVSKYVGETEKNLNALLAAADGEPMVLLFDEADSLFGRRGELRDARDRYANMEVSHLLTRIESHRGPCILTTNLRQHIDTAFLRRFHAVVEFPRPDAEGRAALWALHLPPRAPRATDVDLALVGAAVPLSGAQIRNAAIAAAVIAASRDAPIGLPQLARAIWVELAKDGRELSREMLGALASQLAEEAA